MDDACGLKISKQTQPDDGGEPGEKRRPKPTPRSPTLVGGNEEEEGIFTLEA